jgi:hypothetical protein
MADANFRGMDLQEKLMLDEDPVSGLAEPPGFLPWLRADHDALDALTTRVLAILEEGDSEAVRALIGVIRAQLAEHMQAEERELIPRYAREHPEDAAALLDEHAAFRRLFLELGMVGDLRGTRVERMRALADALTKHAQHENGGLYRWAASR